MPLGVENVSFAGNNLLSRPRETLCAFGRGVDFLDATRLGGGISTGG